MLDVLKYLFFSLLDNLFIREEFLADKDMYIESCKFRIVLKGLAEVIFIAAALPIRILNFPAAMMDRSFDVITHWNYLKLTIVN